MDRVPDFARSDSIKFELEITSPVDGLPVDITGATITFTMKKRPDIETDLEAAIQKDALVLDQVTNLGKALLELSPDDTNVDPGIYSYDFQLKDSADNIQTLIIDTLEVLTDVTRST
jgi:hypothetical protein